MKKTIIALIIGCAVVLSSCGQKNTGETEKKEKTEISDVEKAETGEKQNENGIEYSLQFLAADNS